MFEKEAEDNKPPYACCSFNTGCELWKDGFQKGAEFAYNKAKEEMQEQGLALQSDMDKTIEQNIALKKQIEKMKCCSNCNHFNKESDIEYCQNCERHLVNSLDNFPREEIIKDEWELRR